ncbi:hypothetical protein [Bacillus sp. EB600]|uniref:hypothetical protein n=1 Tax=Bacillus sp. EB600 TaxID=2806345 RepID=UPI0021093E2A|nr:hypothetical protein [Bacillus sp. EB600]MCQ6282207.1 hypothetical protein [Bacillus sp. EB600]
MDLVVDVTAVRPRVIAAKVKTGNKIQMIDFSTFSITKKKNQYLLECKSVVEKEFTSETALCLLNKFSISKLLIWMEGKSCG